MLSTFASTFPHLADLRDTLCAEPTPERAQEERDLARAERDAIAAFLAHPPQTNEVGRSAILMPGYAAVARATGLPSAL